MKKVVSFVAMALAVAGGFAAEEEYVRSSNIHGSVEVLSTFTNTLIAVPWVGYTEDFEPTLQLKADRLVRPTNLTTGDLLLLFTNGQEYAAWELVENTIGEQVEGYTCREWQEIATVSCTEEAVNVTNAHALVFDEAHQDAMTIRGFGLWLYRQNPIKEDGTARPFYLYGQAVTNGASVTFGKATASAADPIRTMLADPGVGRDQPLTLKELWAGLWENTGADDYIVIPTDNVATRECVRLKKRGNKIADEWCYAETYTTVSNGKTVTKQTYVYDKDIQIPRNRGFWYVRKIPGDITITWPAAK